MATTILIKEYHAVRKALIAYAAAIFPAKDAYWHEDLADEAIQRHLAGLANYDFGSIPSSSERREWMVLYLTLRHLGIDRRKQERIIYNVELLNRHRDNPSGVEEALESLEAWESYLATPALTERERRLLRWFIEEGCNSSEIAAFTGQSAEAVRKALSRAYEKIRRHHFRERIHGF